MRSAASTLDLIRIMPAEGEPCQSELSETGQLFLLLALPYHKNLTGRCFYA